MTSSAPLHSRALRIASLWTALAGASLAAQSPGNAERVARALLEARLPAVDAPAEAPFAILAAAARDARSSSSELLVRLAAERAEDVAASAAWRQALADFLAAAPHPLAQLAAEGALVRATIAGDPRAWRDLPAAERPTLDAAPGFARRLLALGPLGDAGDHFVHEPFAATRRFPEPDETVAGRFGPVRPYLRVRDPDSALVDLRRPAEPRGGAFVALHRVRADETVRGFVEVICSASFAVFVDGRQLGVVDRTASRRPDRAHFAVTIGAGQHDVTVLVGSERSAELALRYVDAAGATLAAVTELDPIRTERAASPPGEDFDGRFQTGLDNLLDAAARPDASLTLLAAAILDGFERGATDRALELLHTAETRLAADAATPPDPLTLLALGEIRSRHARDLPTELNQAAARERILAAANLAPQHATAIRRRAAILVGEDRLEDAVTTLREAVDAGVDGPGLRADLAQWLDRLGDRAAAAQWHDAASDFRGLLAEIDRNERELDLDGAWRRIEQAAALRPGDLGLLTRRVRIALAREDWANAIDALRELEARGSTSEYRRLEVRAQIAAAVANRSGGPAARAHALAVGDAELAAVFADPAAAFRALAAHADADTDGLERAGAELLELGDEAGAIDAWRATVARDPSRHLVRRTLARLAGATDGEPDLLAHRLPEREVDALVAAFVPGEREATASSTLLLDRMVVAFRSDGSYVREVHQVRRINDQQGVAEREEASAAAGADEVVRLRTILPDGGSYVPKRVGRTFAMPKLAPGAVIEELWCERVPAPGADPMRGPEFLFRSADEPFVVSELVWIVPDGLRGRPRARNVDFEPVITAGDDGTAVWRWRREDVARIDPEPYAPPPDEIVPAVTWGEDRNSDAELRELRATAHDAYRITPWIRQRTAEVVAGIDDDAARLTAIHAFVNTHVENERGAAEPTAILLRGQGPRFHLEVAMLRAAGVPVELAAVAGLDEEFEEIPRYVGDREFPIPAARVVPRDAAPTWLFADAPRHAPPGFLPAQRAGAATLMLETGVVERLPTDPSTAPGWTVDGTLELAADGSATLTATATLGEVPGHRLADQVTRLERARRDLAARNLAGQLFEGWTVVTAEIPELATGERFRVVATLRRRGLARAADGLLSMPIPLPPSQMAARFGGTPDRDLPLQIVSATLDTWTIRVVTGVDRTLVAAPAGLRIRDRLLDYALDVAPTGDGAVVRRWTALRGGDMGVGLFGEWFAQCVAIDRAETARLAFTSSQ